MNGSRPPFTSTVRAHPWISAAIALTILLGVANFFLWKARHAAAAQHDEVRRKGEQMLRALTNRSRIDSELGLVQAALAQIEKNLLDEQSMEVNLGYFYRMEKPARVRIARLNQLAATPPPVKGAFRTVPFAMQITGTYRNALNYLRALETGPRILRIRQCTFERSTTDNADLTLDLTIEVLAKP